MKVKSLLSVCNSIAFLTALVGATQFLSIATLCYDLGKDGTDTLKWQILVEGIEAWGIILCCILFFTLASRARKERIFVIENESLLMNFGAIIVVLGAVSNALIHVLTIKALLTSTCDLLILIGFAFVFFSLVFKIGRMLKEEQELII